MSVLVLSRLQFAVATYFHFLFVPLTLGLSILLAIMETKYVRTGDEEYRSMARFWGRLFLINFVVGVVTGITLEFQFGTNFSRYSRYVGDIFGPLLAIGATVAFFLESTFIAVWALGWKRVSPKAHAIAIWLVAVAANLSAVWILIANTWMQHPVGYVMQNGRPVLSDFWAVVTQPYAALTILHTLSAGYVVAGFFVMGGERLSSTPEAVPDPLHEVLQDGPRHGPHLHFLHCPRGAHARRLRVQHPAVEARRPGGELGHPRLRAGPPLRLAQRQSGDEHRRDRHDTGGA